MVYLADGGHIGTLSWPQGSGGWRSCKRVGAEAALAPGLDAIKEMWARLLPSSAKGVEGVESIDQIRVTLNPRLEIQGVVLTMHDARTTLSREVADEVRAFFGHKVYETLIPRNTRVAEAPSHGKPILLYDYDCAGSQAYIRLATEIIERERQTKAA